MLYRQSLRAPRAQRPWILGAAITLLFGVACGGGQSAPEATVAASPRPSVSVPPRPALASPGASPSAVSSPVAPAPSSGAGETYKVRSGDTLLSISESFYGDATKWRRIYDANKDVIGADPDELKLDMQLRIPPKE